VVAYKPVYVIILQFLVALNLSCNWEWVSI